MPGQALCDNFLGFLDKSPTPFHATKNLATLLSENGFTQLSEYQPWQTEPGKSYFFTRSDSTIVAFVIGKAAEPENGFRLVGAHTDSPCLKVKPNPESNKKSYQRLGIEVYGGALLNPWFDRDLSIAGKVCFVDDKDELNSTLINFEKPVAVLPSLAIHLNRDANKNKSVNPQTEMNPILFQGDETFSLRELLLKQLIKEGNTHIKEVLEYDLSFYDVQKASLVGLDDAFLVGARLDNLLSSYVAINALCEAGNAYTSIVVCNDHEEVGSRSDIGASGPTMDELLSRLYPGTEQRQIALRHALMFSVDNAHGIHPNYVEKHDGNHGPILNKGPVIKFDANQSYATTAPSAAFVRHLARSENDLPLQSYVTRADMRCGSTIGPLTSALLGVKTIDIGVPTFAMHSVREVAGTKDVDYLNTLLRLFYQKKSVCLV